MRDFSMSTPPFNIEACVGISLSASFFSPSPKKLTPFKRTSNPLKDERTTLLAAVKKNGHALKSASNLLKNDKQVVLAAVSKNGKALRHASKALRNDKQVVLTAINQNIQAIKYASNELKLDDAVILTALREYTFIANKTPLKAIQKNPDREALLNKIETSCGRILKELNIEHDRDIVLVSVNQNGLILKYASDGLKADLEVVLAAVNQHGLALQFACKELKNDAEVVLSAIKQDARALYYASNELKASEDFILTAINQNACVIELLSPDMLQKIPSDLIPSQDFLRQSTYSTL
ncbi:MAG: DUF4116 domain-containing protein [Legionella sp.]|nr:DUF4116 domain-containing protein [Legionella sp.]